MEGFSLTERQMGQFAREAEERRALQPADPWPESERGSKKRDGRLRRSQKSFWYFDKTYFPPEMYEAYYKPNSMMKAIVRHAGNPGVHVELGPRSHGKTITAKKYLCWILLTNRVQVAGTFSHTLPTSQNILDDVAGLIRENPRIMEDFGVEFVEDNREQFQFKTRQHPQWRYCASFSEGKSVRGYARRFARPQFILGDDIETKNSPFGSEHSKERIERVAEAFLSLTDDGSFLWLGNNFDERCATNKLLQEQKDGVLNSRWRVHVYDAWNSTLSRPLWHERYTATTEAELMQQCRAKDQADWKCNFRMIPKRPDGNVFLREFRREYDHLPPDARGVIYCDPNLSLKGEGDETAIVAYLYSPSLGQCFIPDVYLRSFNSSNALLDKVLSMKATFPTGTIFRVGFDGNVSQESSWTNNVRMWCIINKQLFPHIEYQKINVDLFAKNVQSFWEAGNVKVPRSARNNPMFDRALESLYEFTTKKAGGNDDFPDALINAHELICSTGFVRVQVEKSNRPPVESIADKYTF